MNDASFYLRVVWQAQSNLKLKHMPGVQWTVRQRVSTLSQDFEALLKGHNAILNTYAES